MPLLKFILRSTLYPILNYSGWKRRVLNANLKLIYPMKSESETKHLRVALLKNLSKDGADFLSGLTAYKTAPKNISAYPNLHAGFKMEIDPSSKQTLEKMRLGGLMLTAHYGNYEGLGAWLCRLEIPLMASYAPIRPSFLNDYLYNHLRQVDGYHYSTFIQNPRHILNSLDQGNLFCLIADQDYRKGRPSKDTFLGQPVCCNPIPAFILKYRPQTPVFLSWIRIESNQKTLFAKELILGDKTHPEIAIYEFNRWLETRIQEDDTLWYGWLHRRFLCGFFPEKNIYSH
ncbi:MAG: lysophospholipid acyltransferase family protein [Fibrobacteraceae bacterium]